MDGVTTTTCGGIKCMHVSEGKQGKECTVAFGRAWLIQGLKSVV